MWVHLPLVHTHNPNELQSIDVGAALEKMLYDDTTAGQTFELYGPKQYNMGQIAEMVDKEIFKQRRHVNVPKSILKPLAGVLNKALWWHTLSADEIEREFIDQVIDPEAKTFKDLGIEPGDIASFTYHYLVCIRWSWQVLRINLLSVSIARFPQPELLRSPPCDGEREERRQKVYSRLGRVVKRLNSLWWKRGPT